MKRRSAVVALGVVLVAVIAAVEVSAATTPVKTSVTILNVNGERIAGRVTSPEKACMKGRRVTVYIKLSGLRSYGAYPGYEAVGRATTKSNGNWAVRASEAFLEGDYRAFVASKRVTAGDRGLLCTARWGSTKHG